MLEWADNLQNHAGVFQDPNQEWRVDVWDPSDNTVLAELFSTNPGDPPIQDWTVRSADLSPWIGRTIRLAFTQQDNLFFFNARLDAVVVTGAVDVAIDIKPGGERNSINLASNGVIPVALLGSDELDVLDVDPTTLAFGPSGALPAHQLCTRDGFTGHFEDVNGDGFEDLVTHYATSEVGIASGDLEACLSGRTISGQQFEGCDLVTIVPPLDQCGAAASSDLAALPVIGPVNGGFESGDFTGWGQINSGPSGITIDDGIFDPPGPGGPVSPFEGNFSAATFQSGPGLHTLFTDVALDPRLSSAMLEWADNLQNFAGAFQDPSQEWRVEVWDPSDDTVLAELFSTNPGDPSIQDWMVRSADLSPWIGQTIRLAFTREALSFFLNTRLDAVVVTGIATVDAAIDIRPGMEPNFINLLSNGLIRVALLGSDVLDVLDVDPTTLAFGPAGAAPAHELCTADDFAGHIRDVNGDGFDDLVTHYVTSEAGIAFGDPEACLSGQTTSGERFEGCDSIRMMGCGIGFELALLLPPLMWMRRRLRRAPGSPS
jgi:hypothetical protein